MTEIERKALALVNEVARERGSTHDSELLDRAFVENEALCRAIEQHEAFRQEVSDAVVAALSVFDQLVLDDRGEAALRGARLVFARFIIAKPDPLVEHLVKVEGYFPRVAEEVAGRLRTARGLKIVEDK